MIYLLIVNIIGFILMYIDKRRSILHKYRIKESILMSIALIGGSLGIYLGMFSFRHKIKKPKFYIWIPIILIIDILILFKLI